MFNSERVVSQIYMSVGERICVSVFSISGTLLQRRVSELERGAHGFREGGPTGRGEVRRICRERDQLKEVTSQMEAELIQVCHHIHKFT